VIAAMTKAVAALPDDVDALNAMIVAMADQRALLEARNSHLEVVNKTAIATLTAIVRILERSLYGTRSERLRGATLTGSTADRGRKTRLMAQDREPFWLAT
jgi:transposase